MRVLLAFVCAAAAGVASAQPRPPIPPLDAQWRVAVDGGMTVNAMTTVGSVSVEQAWHGPLFRGARAWAVLDPDGGFTDDGPSMTGGGGEAYVVASTRDRWVDLRAGAGLGLATLDYGPGGLGCDPEFEACPRSGRSNSFSGLRPYLVGVVGLDLYLHRAVGLGVEVRPALMQGPANVSTLEIGLRARLGG